MASTQQVIVCQRLHRKQTYCSCCCLVAFPISLPPLLLQQSVNGKVVRFVKVVKSLKPYRTNLPTAPAPLTDSAGTKPTSHPLQWAVASHPIKITEVESHPLQWAVASEAEAAATIASGAASLNVMYIVAEHYPITIIIYITR